MTTSFDEFKSELRKRRLERDSERASMFAEAAKMIVTAETARNNFPSMDTSRVSKGTKPSTRDLVGSIFREPKISDFS